MKNVKIREELDSVEIFISTIQDEYIKRRVNQVLKWDIKRAIWNKRIFYLINITILVLNASIPIINQIKEQSIYVTIISSICTILASIINLINFKDEWYRYRYCVETIKRECMMLSCKCGEYKGENREKIFLINFEQILSKEIDYWKKNKFDNDNTDI